MKLIATIAASLVLLCATAFAQDQRDREVAREIAIQALRDSGVAWSDVSSLQRDLVALGPEVIPTLFEFLVAGEFPGGDGVDTVSLALTKTLALTTALEALPRGPLRALMDSVARQADAEGERRHGLRLLERFGTVDDLGRAIRLADVGKQGTPELWDALRDTLTEVVQGHKDALGELESSLRDLNPDLLSAAASAIASRNDKEAFTALARDFDGRKVARAVILLELRRLGPRLPVPPEPRALKPVRDALLSNDPVIVALAASLVGELNDTWAVSNLIEALDSSKGNTQVVVRSALRRITSMKLGLDSEEWTTWYETQRKWIDQEANAAADQLARGSIEGALQAIQDLATRRVFREEIVSLLLPGLDRREPAVVGRVCAALGELNSWSAVPTLLDTLQFGPPHSREAARNALVHITQLDLPTDAATWRFRIQHLESAR